MQIQIKSRKTLQKGIKKFRLNKQKNKDIDKQREKKKDNTKLKDKGMQTNRHRKCR